MSAILIQIGKLTLILIFFIGIIFGFFFFYIKYIQSQSVFFPSKNIEVTPEKIGLSFSDVYIKTSDNLTIHGWFIPCKDSKHTLLFLHGNGGNISHRLEKIRLLYNTGVNIFIIDYRGYGKSESIPTEQGMYKDALAAYFYLVKNLSIDCKNIILYGESLGGVAAVDLSSKREVGGMILEGVFSSGKDIGKELYSFIPKFMFPNVFNSLEKINKASIPKLFIHSKNDEIVPYDLGRKLYEASGEPKLFIEVTGGHNTSFIDSKKDYLDSITEFIRNIIEKGQ